MSAVMCAGLEGEGQPCACFLAQKARGQQHLGLLRVAPASPPSQQHQPQLHFTMVSTWSAKGLELTRSLCQLQACI